MSGPFVWGQGSDVIQVGEDTAPCTVSGTSYSCLIDPPITITPAGPGSPFLAIDVVIHKTLVYEGPALDAGSEIHFTLTELPTVPEPAPLTLALVGAWLVASAARWGR